MNCSNAEDMTMELGIWGEKREKVKKTLKNQNIGKTVFVDIAISKNIDRNPV